MTPLTHIVPPKQNRRGHNNADEMQKLIASVTEYGVITPLLVRPVPVKSSEKKVYKLVSGQRRYHAAKKAGLKSVPITVQELDDDQALERYLVEKLHRDGLRPLEETKLVLEHLARQLKVEPKEVITLLQKLGHPERKRGDDLVPNRQQEIIQDTFAILYGDKLTSEGFRLHRLPLLNLPEEVKEALENGTLHSTEKARTIGRVKDPQQRLKLLQQTLDENLTLEEIKQRIQESQNPRSTRQQSSEIEEKIYTTFEQICQSEIWTNPDLHHDAKKHLEGLLKLVAKNDQEPSQKRTAKPDTIADKKTPSYSTNKSPLAEREETILPHAIPVATQMVLTPTVPAG